MPSDMVRAGSRDRRQDAGATKYLPQMGRTKRTSRNAPSEEPRVFAQRLLAWYDGHKRDLPWRKDRDPYRVWLSEIMLQQTRVAAVLDHYQRFLKKFLTVQKLAAAREASVLAAWSGLGYYRRARMLHAAAKQVVKEHAGKLPASSGGLRELPGIGRYTAAAIASIAFDQPVAVVDGNVERVVQRFLGKRIAREEVWQTAGAGLDARRPGDFNQAIMELGATVCLPRQPRCLLCPVADLCATRGELPTAETAHRQQKREIHFGLARRNGSVFLVQLKKQESLMAGMWELPEILPSSPHAKPMLSLRHSITVTDYAVAVREISRPSGFAGKWIPISRLESTPLTGLARKILRRAEIL
jgi:A/G-specific adenine glycosylase